MKSLLQQVMESITPPAKLITEDTILWKKSEALPFSYYVKFFADAACRINVKGEHDSQLVTDFLDEVTSENLQLLSKDKPLYLSDSPALTNSSFGKQAIVHPSVSHSALSKTTAFMKNWTFTAFPVYECELSKDETLSELQYRMGKIVLWSDWNRPPSPALRARFLREKSGVTSAGGNRMAIFPMNKVEKIISHIINENGFIDIENFERRLVHIEIATNICELCLEEERWTQDMNTLIPWLRIFAMEGVDASRKAITAK